MAVYLILFQMPVLRQLVEDSWLIAGGLFAVIAATPYVLPAGLPDEKT